MYQLCFAVVASVLFALTPNKSAYAGKSMADVQGKPCPGLAGKARTDCLNAEVARGQQASAAINRKNRNIDRAIGAANTAKYAGGVAAGALGGIAGTAAGGPAAGIVAGEAAAKAYGAATDRISKRTPCKSSSGRSGTANSSAQRCN